MLMAVADKKVGIKERRVEPATASAETQMLT